jgi:hypothetical protein
MTLPATFLTGLAAGLFAATILWLTVLYRRG